MSIKLIVLQCKRYIIQVCSVYPNKISENQKMLNIRTVDVILFMTIR